MPEKLPDLSKHTNFLTDVLKEKPELYEQLKDKKTKLGVTLGHCIKTGIDNPGKTLIIFSRTLTLSIFKFPLELIFDAMLLALTRRFDIKLDIILYYQFNLIFRSSHDQNMRFGCRRRRMLRTFRRYLRARHLCST